MKKLILCGIALIISGCASTKLNDGLPHLIGKKIDYAISYLGYPQSEQKIAGKTVYTWGHNNTFTTYQTVHTPVYGNVGGTFYSGRTTSVVPQTYNYQCTIRLITNERNIIERWEWNGNDGGCRGYANAISNMIDAGTFQ